MQTDPAIVLLIVFVVLFPATWVSSMYLIATVGGWRELARVYRTEGPIAGARVWRNRYGRMRYGTAYNGCLNIAANAMGMQLCLWRILRPGHPMLFIPWSDIRTEPVRGMFFEYIRFSFARAGTTLMLKRSLADEIGQFGYVGPEIR